VSCNPGVKVGGGTFVGGMTMLGHDIPDARFVSTKEGKVDIKENKAEVPGMDDRKKYFN
jgi:acetyltransferase-like isoleucine patch superfamily enzyme